MYLIEYQKANGDILYRTRNTLPSSGIGEKTSMGWLVKDIKYKFNNKYYSASDYHRLQSKLKSILKTKRIIYRLIKKYAFIIILFISIYLFK